MDFPFRRQKAIFDFAPNHFRHGNACPKSFILMKNGKEVGAGDFYQDPLARAKFVIERDFCKQLPVDERPVKMESGVIDYREHGMRSRLSKPHLRPSDAGLSVVCLTVQGGTFIRWGTCQEVSPNEVLSFPFPFLFCPCSALGLAICYD